MMLTNNVSILQVETVQAGERPLGVAHFFEHNVRGTPRLLSVSNSDLADGAVPTKELIEVLA